MGEGGSCVAGTPEVLRESSLSCHGTVSALISCESVAVSDGEVGEVREKVLSGWVSPRGVGLTPSVSVSQRSVNLT